MQGSPEDLRVATGQLDRLDGQRAYSLLVHGTSEAQFAFRDGALADAMDWAASAIDLAREMARHNLIREWEAAGRIARLSSLTLSHVGDNARDRLHLDRLRAEAAALLPDDPAATAERARHWRGLPIDDIRHLREIKNLLTALLLLAEHDPDTEGLVAPWRDVRPLLP